MSTFFAPAPAGPVSTHGSGSAVTAVPAASPDVAAAHFAARLAFETDVSDVAADLAARVPCLVVVDSRSRESWEQGHVEGAVHLPTAEIAARAAETVPAGATVVTYCWGPGCNGATRAALEFARLGHPVKEMIGGFEYWAREGFPVETASGVTRRPADPLTAPVSGASCAC
ncbi:rhodanese-like domain-containing protein [Nonomuraea pusilla]|uniref:Rhodanese-related sulfurtransferase n=1 Tax=Nonomuraea pusilla TaxID=46177 RepID=A0A1H7QGR0_9ACTN|nr:rhodanese-like domain-containing protein [Nonomuraea pusilla]SEL47281.1 Rhodanese-related sulfurtransferase [Nonomuraea pusilla]